MTERQMGLEAEVKLLKDGKTTTAPHDSRIGRMFQDPGARRIDIWRNDGSVTTYERPETSRFEDLREERVN